MASNKEGIADATGAHEDWFEIYNPNNFEVDIAGYYLSDKTTSPKKHKVLAGFAETRIQPHGFLVIWASEKPARGPLHADFALSASGENVVLSAPDGTLIDLVTFGPQQTDYSYGRIADGSNTWSLFSKSTPGASNANGITFQPKLAAPLFSEPAGIKSAAFSLSLTHPDPDVIIRYTIDGSEPVESDTRLIWKYKNNSSLPIGEGLLDESNQTIPYANPIRIEDRSSAANRISMKSSAITADPSFLPDSPVSKGTVVRAKAFKAGSIPSETITRTYFVYPAGAGRYSLPVISLVSDERSFFDYNTGNYTPGIKYDEYKLNPYPIIFGCTRGNFNEDGDLWERPGSFEYFDQGNLVLSQGNVGIRIHGNCSRQSTQKGLRIYSDSRFDYNFFSGQKASPKRLILRAGGNEYPNTGIRDLLAARLVENLSFDSQKSRPSVMFLNGEYWGYKR